MHWEAGARSSTRSPSSQAPRVPGDVSILARGLSSRAKRVVDQISTWHAAELRAVNGWADGPVVTKTQPADPCGTAGCTFIRNWAALGQLRRAAFSGASPSYSQKSTLDHLLLKETSQPSQERSAPPPTSFHRRPSPAVHTGGSPSRFGSPSAIEVSRGSPVCCTRTGPRSTFDATSIVDPDEVRKPEPSGSRWYVQMGRLPHRVEPDPWDDQVR